MAEAGYVAFNDSNTPVADGEAAASPSPLAGPVTSATPPADSGSNLAESMREALDTTKYIYRSYGADVLIVFFASLAVTAQASEICSREYIECKKQLAYGVAVGVVSLVISGCYCIMYSTNSLPGQGGFISSSFDAPLSVFLALWWTAGVAVLTFDQPFTSLGIANGYVGCWLGFIFSVKFCHQKTTAVKSWSQYFGGQAQMKRYGLALMLSSIIVVGSGISVGSQTGTYDGKTVWIIVCAAISFMLTLPLVLAHEAALQWVEGGPYGLFLTVLWLAGVIVATFFGPFQAAGNGYFGCIVSLIVSALLIRRGNLAPQEQI